MSKQGVDPTVKLGINMQKAQIEVSRLYCESLAREYEKAQGIAEKSAIIHSYEQALQQMRTFEKHLRELAQEGEQPSTQP